MRYILAMLALVAATTSHAQLQHAVIRPPRYLPPEEYDYPYKGILVTTVAKNQNEVRKLCPWTPFAALGCAFRYAGGCLIVLANEDTIRAAGEDPDVVRRHEIGHCNGWPAGHPNARRAD